MRISLVERHAVSQAKGEWPNHVGITESHVAPPFPDTVEFSLVVETAYVYFFE